MVGWEDEVGDVDGDLAGIFKEYPAFHHLNVRTTIVLLRLPLGCATEASVSFVV